MRSSSSASLITPAARHSRGSPAFRSLWAVVEELGGAVDEPEPLERVFVDELLPGGSRTARCSVCRIELRVEAVPSGIGVDEMALKAYLGEPLDFVGRRPDPDDYLLYPEKRTPDRRVYWARRSSAASPASRPHRTALGNSRPLHAVGIYGHQDQRDLERAMEAFADARSRRSGEPGDDSPSRLD